MLDEDSNTEKLNSSIYESKTEFEGNNDSGSPALNYVCHEVNSNCEISSSENYHSVVHKDCELSQCLPSLDESASETCEKPGKADDPGNKNDTIELALVKRKQPLMELVSSEESYVRRLKLVKDCYMPAVSAAGSPPLGLQDTSLIWGVPPAGDSQASPPVPPEDLAARWRIVWGNWILLYEWHSVFLEKLTGLVDSDPDKIPKLLIDSRSRLKSIYSKYCENHRKAALIAEQYRDYFEELRVYIGDKEDVVSHLMQPVQRIMRYQLPIAEILKFTRLARSPEESMWIKALDLMKEIPKDTQLILEAARIDGFPGVITALGNILLRGDLLVATTTREQLLETVTAYKVALQEGVHLSGSEITISHAKFPSLTRGTAGNDNPNTNITITTPSLGLPSPSTEGSVPLIPTLTSEVTGLFTGNLKFVESRLFLFQQMLLVTEEVKPKRRVASSDSFAQSTYQFKAAININKMRYESHWYNCNLPSGHTNADATAIDQLLSAGYGPDDLRFAILDLTPGKSVVYVINPVSCSTRDAWAEQLRDIQCMQQNLLLALEDPGRFKRESQEDSRTSEVINEDFSESIEDNQSGRFYPQLSAGQSSITQGIQQPRQRKWPSFTMKRTGRLGSNSSSVCINNTSPGSKEGGIGKHQSARTPVPESQNRSSCLARSLSAERRPFIRDKLMLDAKFGVTEELDSSGNSSSNVYRKSSQSANSSLKLASQIIRSKGFEGSSPDEVNQHSKGGLLKKRNVFVNLFSRGKPKSRNKPNLASHQLSTVSAGVEELDVTDSEQNKACDLITLNNTTDCEIQQTSGLSNAESYHSLESTAES